jgi:hypothetical protein
VDVLEELGAGLLELLDCLARGLGSGFMLADKYRVGFV